MFLFYFILRGYQNERVLSVGGRIGKMGWLALWKNWESGKWQTWKMNPRFPNQNIWVTKDMLDSGF